MEPHLKQLWFLTPRSVVKIQSAIEAPKCKRCRKNLQFSKFQPITQHILETVYAVGIQGVITGPSEGEQEVAVTVSNGNIADDFDPNHSAQIACICIVLNSWSSFLCLKQLKFGVFKFSTQTDHSKLQRMDDRPKHPKKVKVTSPIFKYCGGCPFGNKAGYFTFCMQTATIPNYRCTKHRQQQWKDYVRIIYTAYQVTPVSMTLSDLVGHSLQVFDIFLNLIPRKICHIILGMCCYPAGFATTWPCL